MAGLRPDRPPHLPAPLPLRLVLVTAWAVLDAALQGLDGRRRRLVASLAVTAPFVLAQQRLEEAARRRRAARLGLRRATDAPPPRPAIGTLPLTLAMGWARGWDARRRGAWPPSWATLAGAQWSAAVQAERRWRRDLRRWHARRHRQNVT